MKTFVAIVVAVLCGTGWCLAAPAADESSQKIGTWSLNNWTPGDDVHLTLSYRKGTSRWEWSSNQAVADLKGLTAGQLRATHASVAFTLKRDAGAFAFDGSILLGIGRGDFRFDPDPTYAAKLSALGYGPIGDDALAFMLMAVRDVSLEFAAEVKYALKDAKVSDLVRLLDHGVDLGFIRSLVAAGYGDLTADDVVRFRDHGIDGEFLRGLKASGASGFVADDIVRLHDHGVSSDYVARMHAAGYGDLTADQIIKLHDHGVD
jgi:hypothetical protein